MANNAEKPKTLRDELLGMSPEPKKQIVKIKKEGGGELTFEVREPTLAVRNKARNASTTEGRIDFEMFELRLVVQCTFEKDTSKRVFADGDEKIIMAGVNQKWIWKLRTAVAELTYELDALEDEDEKNV